MNYQIMNGINPLVTSQISMLFNSCVYPPFIYFSYYFPHEKEKRYKSALMAFCVLAALSSYFSLSGAYISKFEIVNNIGVRRFTPFIYYFVIYSLISATFGLYNLLETYFKTKSALFKNQLQYIFVGLAIGFSIAFTFSLFMPIFGNNQLFFIGETGPIFLIGFSTYVIVKHRLLDIEIVFRKGIIYSALLFTISAGYTVLTIILGRYLQNITGYSTLFINLISALIIVAGYKPLETFIENATDRIFFKGKYDYQKTLKSLSREISAITDMNLMMFMIIKRITETMKIDKVSIWLKEEKEGWREIKIRDDPMNRAVVSEQIKVNAALLKYLAQKREPILLEEIEHQINIQKMPDKTAKQLALVKSILKRKNITAIIPIINRSELAGTLNLGSKLSGDIYTLQDLELLTILVNQTSVALENAKLKEQLERSDRLAVMGRFASSLAHEIRNPLTSIKAFFQMLNGDEDENDIQEISELALTEIARVEGLLNNLLHFARPRKPEFSGVNLDEVLNETLIMARSDCVLSNVQIHKNAGKRIPETFADRSQLKQVFLNLIQNALQAMPDGGTLQINMAHCPEEDAVKITFTDSGRGIDKEHLPRLFEPFFTTKTQGTGLGLNISHRIITAHKGRIFVESKKGKGTSVHVILPAQ
jgi:signal transduction histidine kinase